MSLVRQARHFEYLLLVFLGASADRALVRRAIDELTPASPLWALNFGNVAGTAIIATGEPESYVEYAMKIVDAQPSKALKGTAAAGIINSFGISGLVFTSEPLIAKAKAEAGDQNILKSVLAQYGAERRIQKDKLVPAFRASSLDDAALVYTENSLKGKVYLIDFWATWCLPCIESAAPLYRVGPGVPRSRPTDFGLLPAAPSGRDDLSQRSPQLFTPRRVLAAVTQQADNPPTSVGGPKC